MDIRTRLLLLFVAFTGCNAAVVLVKEAPALTPENAEIPKSHEVAESIPVQTQVQTQVETKPDENIHKKRDVPESPVDDNGKYVGKFNDDCSETFIITPQRKTANIEPEKDILNSATACHWNVIGTERCVPVLTCKKFQLESGHGDSDDPCPGEYLEVTDGSLGYTKYCGSDGPMNVITSRKLRDMYITLKTSADSKIKKRELKCQITCCEKGDDGTKLPDTSEPEEDENCFCGRKPNSNRIVGGEDAKKGEFPWMAALATAPTRRPFCGGSVINDRLILTAAHCFKGPYVKSKNIHVLLNAHHLDLTGAAAAKGEKLQKMIRTLEEIKELDEKEHTLRFTIEKYFIHPLYIRQTNDYDVALIKVDRPIDFVKNKHVSPICLPKVDAYMENKEGASCVVAGWGLNSSDATQTMGTLQKLNLDIFKNSECKGFFDQRFTRRMLCAGYREGGKDSCKGDSGGPLISEKSRQIWEQVGIVSWGEGCAEKNSPGVYANTREVIQWIRYISNLEEAKWCQG